jgi:hypothetical protein
MLATGRQIPANEAEPSSAVGRLKASRVFLPSPTPYTKVSSSRAIGAEQGVEIDLLSL